AGSFHHKRPAVQTSGEPSGYLCPSARRCDRGSQRDHDPAEAPLVPMAPEPLDMLASGGRSHVGMSGSSCHPARTSGEIRALDPSMANASSEATPMAWAQPASASDRKPIP